MITINDILAPILRSGLTYLSRRSLPKINGKITLAGLSDPVDVLRDHWGIPHIYANNTQDLFFAQGFVHAQDRLWQMELNRRIAQGKLSELFGELALETDRTVRTFGFNRLAREDWFSLDAEAKEVILAYTAGVNAFLERENQLPIEFTMLRHKPEPWDPLDSTAFMRVMIWQLSHAWYSELVRAQVSEAVGQDYAAELEIQYPSSNPEVLPNGIEFNSIDPDGRLQKMASPFLERGMGSNAWAVSGKRSVTGSPYLCNDMHLALSLPGLWYQAHLIAEDFQAIGVTLPGVPTVLVGHNAHLAWGMTLAFTDCEDVFVEKFHPENPLQYQFKGEWLEAKVIEEPIQVKGRADLHKEHVIITRHGPVISDVVGYAKERLAVNSMALRPCLAFHGFLNLNKARNWDEFVKAMRLIEAPQLNVAYADVEGNIGYWVTGKVPIRARGDGSVPAPGWSGEYEWIGEVPFEAMPHALNPEQGYIVHTNNRIVPDDYPYFLGKVWMNGFRARRIVDVLETKEELSMGDFRQLHVDFTCIPGLELIKRLKGIDSSDPDVQLAIKQLSVWDGKLTSESLGGAMYEVIRYTIVRNLLDPALGSTLSMRLMGQGFHPVLLPSNEFFGHDTVALLRFLDNPDSWWVKGAGGREAVIINSLKKAVEWFRENLGPNPQDWQWGRIHRSIFAHPLSIQKPLDQVFDRGPYPIGGDADTPCQTSMHPNDPYDNKSWAPTFRQIVDMGDLSKSIGIIPPGQSGQLGSRHYDDLIQPWLNGEYFPLYWIREQVENAAESHLIIMPVRN